MGSAGLEPSTRCAIDAVTALRLVHDDVHLGARRPLVGPSVLRSHALSMLYQDVRRGALDEKTKELIAMAIGVASRCDGCLGFHAKALVRLGATPQEFREMLGVAVYMGGGPSLMYAANAQAAYDEFMGAAGSA
mgnify:CR=1 FL=1